MNLHSIKKHPPNHCLFCGAITAITGIFTPDERGAWSGDGRKARIFQNYLCSKCHGWTESPKRVEKIIRTALIGGVTHAE